MDFTFDLEISCYLTTQTVNDTTLNMSRTPHLRNKTTKRLTTIEANEWEYRSSKIELSNAVVERLMMSHVRTRIHKAR